MSKLQLDPEFVRLLQGIYGDADLDGGTIKRLYEIWQTNPQYIRTAFDSKQKAPTLAPLSPKPARLNVPTPEPQMQKITLPQREIAQDDLSGITNFGDAFREASRRKLGYFKWRSTKANPSGLFKVEFATNKQTPTKPATTPTTPTNKPATTPQQKPTSSPTSQSTPATQRRGVMSKAYYKSMIDKGFTWDSKKQMWNKPKTTQSAPAAPAAKPAPTSTMREWRWTDGLLGKGVKWSWNIMDGISLSTDTSKLQQGGKLEDSQKAFVAYLIQVSGAQSEQELNDFIQSLGEEGLKQQYQQFVQTMQNGTQSAKKGAKLNYIKSLRGVCPEGFELGYFKEGGQICAKCVEKREKMGGIPFKPIQGEKGTKVVQDFKKDLKNKKDKITIDSKKKPEKKELGGALTISPELLDMFKCGGKSKKAKKEEGGLMKKKQGIPIKEKFIDKDKCGKKMKKKK